MAGVEGVHGYVEGVGVGEANILRRKARYAAGNVEWVLTGFEHAREPVYGGIGVGVAHRLVQRTDDVVVLLTRLVVE